MIKKFQKRPVRVEVIQWLPENSLLEFYRIQDFVGKALIPYFLDPEGKTLGIQTLEGTMRVSPGDWVIKGIHGEFYPCKPDIFEKTYVEICEKCSGTVDSHREWCMEGFKHMGSDDGIDD